MKKIILCTLLGMLCAVQVDAQQRREWPREPFTTDTLMVHDPVMAFEDGTYYIYSTGIGIGMATSKDRKTWTVYPEGVLKDDIPVWTQDSVPGFKRHIWAPDIIRWRGQWWMMYSCSTFGKNGSAIGLLTNKTLNPDSPDYRWEDCGAVVVSKEGRDNWNAIDPCIVIDDEDQPWVTWGSFWDGIQIARAPLQLPPVGGVPNAADLKASLSGGGLVGATIARRYAPGFEGAEPNPTSKYAGTNAIEAPFIMKHDGWYYLFVSWDYCCRGAKSNYRVAVGRSRDVRGPYLDRDGRDMRLGGGTLFIEGDHQEYEAMGHCAAYHMDGKDIFICHGYSVALKGASILVQKEIHWTEDGWPWLVEG